MSKPLVEYIGENVLTALLAFVVLAVIVLLLIAFANANYTPERDTSPEYNPIDDPTYFNKYEGRQYDDYYGEEDFYR